MRFRSRTATELMFVGWHNIEVHAINAWKRDGLFLTVPNWWVRLEPSRHLPVTSPPVFSYYSNCERSEGPWSEAVLSIAGTELIVTNTVSCLETARGVVHWKAMKYGRIIDGGGVLVTLPVGNYDQVPR